eukprot:2586304-Amphidinium_carterae.1
MLCTPTLIDNAAMYPPPESNCRSPGMRCKMVIVFPHSHSTPSHGHRRIQKYQNHRTSAVVCHKVLLAIV